MNTDQDIHYEAFPRAMVEAVDSLIAFANKKQSPNKRVEGEGDWELITRIFQMWCIYQPGDYRRFSEQQKFLRSVQKNNHGSAKEGEAIGQHQLEVPPLVDYLIRTFFPNQRTQDRKFVYELARRLPILRVPEKL